VSASVKRTFEVDVNHSIKLWCQLHSNEMRGVPALEYPYGDGNLMINTTPMECPMVVDILGGVDDEECEVIATVDASWVATPVGVWDESRTT